MKKIALFILAVWLVIPEFARATTPVISSVTGTVTTGQTLTLIGTTMVDEDKTNWNSDFTSGTKYGFEGASYTADDYQIAPNEGTFFTPTYDSTVKIMGDKSFKCRVTGSHETNAYCGLANNDDYVLGGTDYFVRMYARWNSVGTTSVWPTSHIKMLDSLGGGQPDQMYYQPMVTDGTELPTQMNAQWDGTPHGYNVSHFLENNRWYCMEARFKTSAPTNFTVWADGVQLVSATPGVGSQGTTEWFNFGIINMAGTGSDFDMTHWVDSFTISTSRVYCASTIEIGNSSNYATATKVYQAPTTLSDTSIVITADLTGLGDGPYYLWVTNNKQERSTAYNLSGGASVPTATGCTLSGVSLY